METSNDTLIVKIGFFLYQWLFHPQTSIFNRIDWFITSMAIKTVHYTDYIIQYYVDIMMPIMCMIRDKNMEWEVVCTILCTIIFMIYYKWLKK